MRGRFPCAEHQEGNGHLIPRRFHGDRLKALAPKPTGPSRARREDLHKRPLNALNGPVEARLAYLDQLTDEERATITNVIDALVTGSKFRRITSGAG